MATLQQSAVEPTPAAPRPRRGLAFMAGATCGGVALLAMAYFYGPRSSILFEDPLTGRHREETTWLDITLSQQTFESEVSRWADRNSIQGVYPGQYGWNKITQTRRRWFSGGMIACGGGFDIPNRIFLYRITIEGATREQVLQKYQADLVAGFKEHESTISAQRRWAAQDARP